MDKIEKIRKEIERLYDGEAPKHDQQCDFDDGYFTGIGAISQFLDTLESEKPISQDGLEKEISTWIPAHISGGDNGVWNTKKAVTEWAGIVARHFAEWGADHLRDSTKMVDKDLEEAAEEYASSVKGDYAWSDGPDHFNFGDLTDAFIAGAKWQEKHDEETIKTAEDHAFLAGAEWQKEQLMKEAVEGIYTKSMDGKNVFVESGALKIDPASVRVGDKVKLIVIKED